MSKQADPERLWQVRFFARDRYIDVEVYAGNPELAKTMAFHSVIRDGTPGYQLSFVSVKEV